MSDAQVHDYLQQPRTLTCATNGPRGLPHLAPLFYDVDSPPDAPRLTLVAWTYGASQKVANLRRDPRATLQVESGTRYDELAGVMLETDVEIIEDQQSALEVGRRLAHRYRRGGPDGDALVRQAAKRVVLRFHERRRASWDHAHLHDAEGLSAPS